MVDKGILSNGTFALGYGGNLLVPGTKSGRILFDAYNGDWALHRFLNAAFYRPVQSSVLIEPSLNEYNDTPVWSSNLGYAYYGEQFLPKNGYSGNRQCLMFNTGRFSQLSLTAYGSITLSGSYLKTGFIDVSLYMFNRHTDLTVNKPLGQTIIRKDFALTMSFKNETRLTGDPFPYIMASAPNTADCIMDLGIGWGDVTTGTPVTSLPHLEYEYL